MRSIKLSSRSITKLLSGDEVEVRASGTASSVGDSVEVLNAEGNDRVVARVVRTNGMGVMYLDALIRGTVKWFSSRRGYGFVVPDGLESSDNTDYIVHWSEIQENGYKALVVGQQVLFFPSRGDRGLVAKRVIPIK